MKLGFKERFRLFSLMLIVGEGKRKHSCSVVAYIGVKQFEYNTTAGSCTCVAKCGCKAAGGWISFGESQCLGTCLLPV